MKTSETGKREVFQTGRLLAITQAHACTWTAVHVLTTPPFTLYLDMLTFLFLLFSMREAPPSSSKSRPGTAMGIFWSLGPNPTHTSRLCIVLCSLSHLWGGGGGEGREGREGQREERQCVRKRDKEREEDLEGADRQTDRRQTDRLPSHNFFVWAYLGQGPQRRAEVALVGVGWRSVVVHTQQALEEPGHVLGGGGEEGGRDGGREGGGEGGREIDNARDNYMPIFALTSFPASTKA